MGEGGRTGGVEPGGTARHTGGMKTLLMVLLAILLPPVAVFLKVGATKHLWINIILCLLFVLPGTIHALIVVLTDITA